MKSALMIRALVVASLALLVSGAVAPLLTTERFYFFSNTFSLVSGIRQLFVNDQPLVGALIALFSLCVPVAKAAVIWAAASGHASSRPLLLVADRLGKWSMLEVFIAALLIMALKIGPVVDATLHYGVWLLAGSVLLSGTASQLLVHRPGGGPLFSSPETLTIGAIGGALAATSLIGILNLDLLRFDVLLGTPESRCIERTLRLDRLYAASSENEAEYAKALGRFDPASCPEEFLDAFADYVTAWERLAKLEPEGETGEPGLLDRAFALVGLSPTREEALADIEAAWQTVVRAAAEYGVAVPAK